MRDLLLTRHPIRNASRSLILRPGNLPSPLLGEEGSALTSACEWRVPKPFMTGLRCYLPYRRLTEGRLPGTIGLDIELRVKGPVVPESEEYQMKEIESESIRAAMHDAWHDHHHARDQTWRALQIEFFIAAAVVGANWQMDSPFTAVISVLLVIVVALCGVEITVHYRNRVEDDKFRHIMHCEEALGLRRDDLIDGVKPPQRIKFWDVFNPWRKNTALFILRMHVGILMFALLFLGWRIAQIAG